MTDRPAAARPFDAVLCDVDNVIRHFDSTHLESLERVAGLAEGTTKKVAFSPRSTGRCCWAGSPSRSGWRPSRAG